MVFSNKKSKSSYFNKQFSDNNQNQSRDAGQNNQNVIGEKFELNGIKGVLIGIFNTEGNTAAIFADLDILCECDRFNLENCETCAQRISPMESGPGDGLYALYELFHDDYEFPIGALSIFDQEATQFSIKPILDRGLVDESQIFAIPLDYRLLTSLNQLTAYHWDTLNIDSDLFVADALATWEEKTAILHIEAFPGEYDVIAFCVDDPAPVPFAFITLHKDLSHVLTDIIEALPITKSEIAHQNSGRMVVSNVMPVLENTYAMNRVIAFTNQFAIDAISWVICGVLDGHEQAIQLAKENDIDFDSEATPVHMKRFYAQGLRARGRRALGAELYESIVTSPPQERPEDELERQAALNDYLFSYLIPTKNFDRAIELINQSLQETGKLTSEKVNTISNAAQVYYLKGDYESCIERAQRVLDHMKNQDYDAITQIDLTGEASYWKGMALIQLGDVESGKSCLITSAESSDGLYVGRAKHELSALT